MSLACSHTAKKQQRLGLKFGSFGPQIPPLYSLVTGLEVKIQASQSWGFGGALEARKPDFSSLYLLDCYTQVLF